LENAIASVDPARNLVNYSCVTGYRLSNGLVAFSAQLLPNYLDSLDKRRMFCVGRRTFFAIFKFTINGNFSLS
jgi:hypothetical protein